MPDHNTVSISGTVTHVFGHRFVVETAAGAVLADLTPKGLAQHTPRIGDDVGLTGEMKPSELKVSRLVSGGRTIMIDHKAPHAHDHPDAEPGKALDAARKAGFEPLGEPRRKPKHFEVLGRRDHQFAELHIELDGFIRKTKPIDALDDKWRQQLQGM